MVEMKENVMINASILPTEDLAEMVMALEANQAIFKGEWQQGVAYRAVKKYIVHFIGVNWLQSLKVTKIQPISKPKIKKAFHC